jgi:hypothetical protein
MSSSPYITIPSSSLREFWRQESRRCGTDWLTLTDTVERVLHKLRTLHIVAVSS